jgi:hypothetical protein
MGGVANFVAGAAAGADKGFENHLATKAEAAKQAASQAHTEWMAGVNSALRRQEDKYSSDLTSARDLATRKADRADLADQRGYDEAQELENRIYDEAEADKNLERDIKLENAKAKAKAQKDEAYGNRKTAEQRNLDMLLETGIASTPKEAWEEIKKARTDPLKAISDYTKLLDEQQKAAYIKPGNQNYKPVEQLAIEARDLVSKLNENRAGGSGQLARPQTQAESEITEADIAETARANGMTREQVIDRLRAEGRI